MPSNITRDIPTAGSAVVAAPIASNFNTAQTEITNLQADVGGKQATLVGSGAGQNIKTVNGESLLGAGNVTVAGGGGGTVTAVTAGTGLASTPPAGVTVSGELRLANTTVTAGAYTNTNLTVDAQGRITAASNGSGGAGDGGVARAHYGPTAPPGMNASTAGTLWMDDNEWTFKVWDGAGWQLVP